MVSKFEGKVVFITGAASGIGRATAFKLAAEGASLSLHDLNAEGLSALLKEFSNSAKHTVFPLDVGSSEQCDAAIADTLKTHGQLDFVFNCAGINPTSMAITETTDEYFDKLVNTNLRGPYNITRAAVPHLKAGSAVVNVASVAGLRASSGYSIYNATKFGIIGFTKSMALELGPKGVRVNCVAPGPVDTPTMAANVAGGDATEQLIKSIALGRVGQPDEIADVVAFLFSDDSRFMNGSVVEITGGMR